MGKKPVALPEKIDLEAALSCSSPLHSDEPRVGLAVLMVQICLTAVYQVVSAIHHL
jgi:hypothetical protein